MDATAVIEQAAKQVGTGWQGTATTVRAMGEATYRLWLLQGIGTGCLNPGPGGTDGPSLAEYEAVKASRPEGCTCLGLGGVPSPARPAAYGQVAKPAMLYATGFLDHNGVMWWASECAHCDEGRAVTAMKEAAALVGEADAAEAREEAALAAIKEAIATSGLSPRLLEYTWADFSEKPIPVARLRALRPGGGGRGVFLTGVREGGGGFGTGKTTLAHLALRDWIEAGGSGLFVTVADWLDWARPADDGHGTRGPASRAHYVGLLVMDDLGAESLKAWGREQLFRLLEHRKARSYPTIWTSNYSLDRVVARLVERDDGDPIEGRRLVERIIETCDVILVDGRNYRLGGGA